MRLRGACARLCHARAGRALRQACTLRIPLCTRAACETCCCVLVQTQPTRAAASGEATRDGVHTTNATACSSSASGAQLATGNGTAIALGVRVLLAREPIGQEGASHSGCSVFTTAGAAAQPVAFMYVVQEPDGTHSRCDRSAARRLELQARTAADAWTCPHCSASGWSIERARICLSCGAPSPADEAEMAALKVKARARMAEQRPKRLGGRRITSERERLSTAAPAQGVYAAAARGDDAQASLTAVASEQTESLWRGLAMDSRAWLDSHVSMLTLGNQGITRPELRSMLKPATIAHVYMLTPRRVTRGTAMEQGAAPESAAPASTYVVMETRHSAESAAIEDVAADSSAPESSATVHAILGAANEGAVFECQGTAGAINTQAQHTSRDFVAASDAPVGEAAHHRSEEGPARPVLPHGLAHWAALRELPGEFAATWLGSLEALLRARQGALTQRLDAFSVPASMRDQANVLCGVLKVCYAKLAGPRAAWQWQYDGMAVESCAAALYRLLNSESTCASEHDAVRCRAQQVLAACSAHAPFMPLACQLA